MIAASPGYLKVLLQVKRRSNTTVAQVRAKIIALQQQQLQQEQEQEAASSGERLDAEDSDNAGCRANNGHATMVNGRVPYVKQPLQQKRSNVQIRLIQPSSNEPTATCVEAEPLAMRGTKSESGLSVSKQGDSSFYSLSDIDDESPEDTAGITNSTLIGTKSADTDDPPSSVVLNAAPGNNTGPANGSAVKGCPTEGGVITTGPGGSVDFSTEDETEYYIDDWQTPSAPVIERKRSSLTIPLPAAKTPQNSSATLSEPRGNRTSTFSQSEFTSTTFTGPATTVASTAVITSSQKRGRFQRPAKKESVESSRERRAGRTLAIITGIFIVSWLPFFILALIRPLCGAACAVPRPVDSVFVWLGYVNSVSRKSTLLSRI